MAENGKTGLWRRLNSQYVWNEEVRKSEAKRNYREFIRKHTRRNGR